VAEPELEHAARRRDGVGDRSPVDPLAEVADVDELDVAALELGLQFLDRQLLDP
jgi:hypothetical protein